MSFKLGERRGPYFVVMDAFKMSSGRFSPTFVIYEGSPEHRTAIKRQEFPAPGPDYSTAEEALRRASDMVDEWLAENRI